MAAHARSTDLEIFVSIEYRISREGANRLEREFRAGNESSPVYLLVRRVLLTLLINIIQVSHG